MAVEGFFPCNNKLLSDKTNWELVHIVLWYYRTV